MTKIMSVRLDDHVAALVTERASRRGVSINQEINDSILAAAEADLEGVRERTRSDMARYATVMDRLG
jgi:hypothetical protein